MANPGMTWVWINQQILLRTFLRFRAFLVLWAVSALCCPLLNFRAHCTRKQGLSPEGASPLRPGAGGSFWLSFRCPAKASPGLSQHCSPNRTSSTGVLVRRQQNPLPAATKQSTNDWTRCRVFVFVLISPAESDLSPRPPPLLGCSIHPLKLHACDSSDEVSRRLHV